MQSTDLVRIRHMLDAAREAVSFIAGKNRQDLDGSRMLALSLVKDIEILGEAASKVSEEGKRVCPDIPWRDIIAMQPSHTWLFSHRPQYSLAYCDR